MSKKIIPIILICLFFSLNLIADKFSVQISYGGWTLSPFISVIEKESEEIISDELYSLVSSLLPDAGLSAFHSDVDLSSKGTSLDFSMMYRFGKSNLSLGMKGQVYSFRLPYSLDSMQSINFLGYPLLELEAQAEGTINLRSLILTPLVRWTTLSTKRFTLSLYGGLSALHFNGDFLLEGDILVRTPLGDLEYQGVVSQTIEEIQEWNEGIPSWLFAPSLGMIFDFRLSKEFGLLAEVSLSHGFFFSAGFFFALGSDQSQQ